MEEVKSGFLKINASHGFDEAKSSFCHYEDIFKEFNLEISAYKNENLSLKNKIISLKNLNSILVEQVRLFTLKVYGKKSEKISPEQLYLFNEAEKGAADERIIPDPSKEDKILIPAHERIRGKRQAISPVFPRVEVIHDLKEEEKICPEHKVEMVKISEEISEQLDIIPAKVQVIQNIRYKYSCPICEGNIKLAALPPACIPKSNASPGLLAHLITGKFQDHLPFYRQEGILNRLGMNLTRGTICRWMLKIAELVQPLINIMMEDLLASHYIHCDETWLKVIKEKNSKSFMWVLVNGDKKGPQITIYHYDPSRRGQVALGLLEDFEGYLQTDGFKAYNLVAEIFKKIIHLACWAHARRKFYDAFMSLPKDKKTANTLSYQGYSFIKEIYKIENTLCLDKSPEEVKNIRQQNTKPILNKMREWLDENISKVPPKTNTGKAMGYVDGLWPKLLVFLEDGRLSPDNNPCENKIRPFAVGRKNWLFANIPEGAQASASLYSLIESAKANHHEPYFYLKKVFELIPLASTLEDFEKLLPYKMPPQTYLKFS